MAKNKETETTTRLAAAQGDYKVGNKHPPKEHQFKPGQSGNPKGPQKHRVNLWLWFCKYMAMDDKQIAKLDQTELTQAQQAALKLVKNIKKGSERLALHIFDRDEGRVPEHIYIGQESTLTDEECDQIRASLLNSGTN